MEPTSHVSDCRIVAPIANANLEGAVEDCQLRPTTSVGRGRRVATSLLLHWAAAAAVEVADGFAVEEAECDARGHLAACVL